MIAKNAFSPRSSGPGEIEHRATECPQEHRRPLDLQWLVGQADQVVLADEGLDAAVLLAAEIEQVRAGGVVGGDGIEHTTDQRRVVALGRRRLVGEPCRPGVTGQADHLGANEIEFALGLLEDPFRRQLGRAHRMNHLAREHLRAEARLALARGQDDVPQMGREVVERGTGRGRRGVEAWSDRGDGGIGRGVVGRRERIGDELLDAGQLADRGLGLEAPDRSTVAADETRLGALEHGRDPLKATGEGGQPVGDRRELAGHEREQTVTEEIDPLERVPRLLAQLDLGEAMGFELHDHEVAIDGVVGGKVGHRAEHRQPAIDEVEAGVAAGLARVGPAIVVSVIPERRRPGGLDDDELVEEGLELALEVGHGRILRSGAPLPSRACPHRPRPGSCPSPWTGRSSAWSRWPRRTSMTSRGWPSMTRSGAGRSRGRRTTRVSGRGWRRPWPMPRPAREVPFATIDVATGRAVGSSRFMTIVPEHKRLEIGWTWLGREAQRTGANRAAKLLQLTHAFEKLDAERVEFKTHARNEASRAALLGIGATFEGVLRHHTFMPDGSNRDSAFYSVLAGEWPAVKARLEAGLANRSAGRR